LSVIKHVISYFVFVFRTTMGVARSDGCDKWRVDWWRSYKWQVKQGLVLLVTCFARLVAIHLND